MCLAVTPGWRPFLWNRSVSLRRHLVLLHRWAGLLAAGLLSIAALSGMALVYRKSLLRALVTPGAELPADYAVADVGEGLGDIALRYPPGERALIKAPGPDEPYWTLTGEDGEVRLLAIDTLLPHVDRWRVLDLLAWLRELHVDLLAGVAGEMAMLLAGLVALGLSLSGLVLWWPSRRQLHGRWLLPRRLESRRLLHYHRHSGAVWAPLLVLVVLTATLMLWQKLVAPLLPPVTSTRLPWPEAAAESTPAAWLDRASRAVPDGWPTYIRLPRDETRLVSVRFRLPGEWHPNGRTSVRLDLARRELVASARSDQASPGRHAVNLLYPLHAGYGMPAWYALLILLSGIVTLWLAGTSLASYLRRRRR